MPARVPGLPEAGKATGEPTGRQAPAKAWAWATLEWAARAWEWQWGRAPESALARPPRQFWLPFRLRVSAWLSRWPVLHLMLGSALALVLPPASVSECLLGCGAVWPSALALALALAPECLLGCAAVWPSALALVLVLLPASASASALAFVWVCWSVSAPLWRWVLSWGPEREGARAREWP